MLITIPKRRPKRLRIFLDGSLETIEGRQDVRVRDLSQEGVMIETSAPPCPGETVTLLCAEHQLAGIVLWREDGRCGIRFERPLQPAVWKEFSGQPMRVGAPRNYSLNKIAVDDIQIEVTPRKIRLRERGRTK